VQELAVDLHPAARLRNSPAVIFAFDSTQQHMLCYLMQVLAVDLHPAARLGHGILLDHGTGVVIGETAVIGNNVSLLQVGHVMNMLCMLLGAMMRNHCRATAEPLQSHCMVAGLWQDRLYAVASMQAGTCGDVCPVQHDLIPIPIVHVIPPCQYHGIPPTNLVVL
jgi:hypothetical protein